MEYIKFTLINLAHSKLEKSFFFFVHWFELLCSQTTAPSELRDASAMPELFQKSLDVCASVDPLNGSWLQLHLEHSYCCTERLAVARNTKTSHNTPNAEDITTERAHRQKPGMHSTLSMQHMHCFNPHK